MTIGGDTPKGNGTASTVGLADQDACVSSSHELSGGYQLPNTYAANFRDRTLGWGLFDDVAVLSICCGAFATVDWSDEEAAVGTQVGGVGLFSRPTFGDSW